MYSSGSTVGVTNWPRFESAPDEYKSLPRPYANSKPNGNMNLFFQNPWFHELTKTVETILFHYCVSNYMTNSQCGFVLHALKRSHQIIPNSIRICDTAFTNITVTTAEESGSMKPHTDEDDLMTAILHVGDDVKGGGTNYFDGVSMGKLGDICHKENFQNGKLSIGFFDEIYHSVSNWEGNRYAINFIMKKSIYDHFDDYGSIFYSQLVDREYDGNGLIACLPLGYTWT